MGIGRRRDGNKQKLVGSMQRAAGTQTLKQLLFTYTDTDTEKWGNREVGRWGVEKFRI